MAVRVRRVLWPVVASVVIVAVMLIAIFPTRTYLAQRGRIAATQERIEVLSERNGELAHRVEELQTDAEIERLAREQYSLVRPGEEAYAILPAPETDEPSSPAGAAADARESGAGAPSDTGVAGAPDGADRVHVGEDERSVWERALDGIDALI